MKLRVKIKVFAGSVVYRVLNGIEVVLSRYNKKSIADFGSFPKFPNGNLGTHKPFDLNFQEIFPTLKGGVVSLRKAKCIL